MDPKDFTGHQDVFHQIEDLKRHFKNKGGVIVSDILDQEGNQYVDLVQEGGGVLGIALIGYLYVMEEMGIRFLNLAGTSAGSISTLLLAALGTPDKRKSDELIRIVANKDFNDFVDGDKDARKFIATAIRGKRRFKLLFRGAQILDNLKNDLGLNPGDHFHLWLTDILKNNDIENTKQLKERISTLPKDLYLRGHTNHKVKPEVKIKILTSDITTNSKIIFPEMGELYYQDVDESNPADFVRASMSIPIFFQPFKKYDIPSGIEQMKKWDKLLKYRGNIPTEILFVDGGIMSNFPIDVFHRHNKVPRKPTFGVKLGYDRDESNEIENPLTLLYSCFNSARQIRDFEFIFNNNEFEQLVAYVETDDYNWLNFDLGREEKIGLFLNGVKSACSFLKEFDWERYKAFRRGIIRRKALEVIGKDENTERRS